MEYIILSAYFILFLAFIIKCRFFTFKTISRKYVLTLFLIKIFASAIFLWIYTYHYPQGLDSETTFQSSVKLYQISKNDPQLFIRLMGFSHNDEQTLYAGVQLNKSWFKDYEQNFINENRTVIRFHALLNFFSCHFYKVHLLMLCFFVFCGSFFLYHFFQPQTKKEDYLCIFACFLIPSTLFWTSGILKESLFFFAMSAYLYFFQKSCSQPRFWYIFTTIFFATFMVYSRLYISIILLSMSIIYFIGRFIHKHIFAYYLGMLTLGFGLLVGMHFLWKNSSVDIFSNIANKNQNFIRMEMAINGQEKKMSAPILQPNIGSIISHSPQALFNTLFVPCSFKSYWHILAFMESVFFILLIFNALFFLLLKKKNSYNNKQYFLLFFSIIIFVIIGLTTPNAGAIYRYKSVILPLWAYTLFYPIFDKSTKEIF